MKKLQLSLLITLLSFLMTSCSLQKKDVVDMVFSIYFDDIEIVVGETTFQAIADTVYLDDLNLEQIMEENSYYTGIMMYSQDDVYIGSLDAYVESDAPLKDAIIAGIHIDASQTTNANITIEGYNIFTLTYDEAKTIFSDLQFDDLTIDMPNTTNYSLSITFQDENTLSTFSHTKLYDVDWNT